MQEVQMNDGEDFYSWRAAAAPAGTDGWHLDKHLDKTVPIFAFFALFSD